MSRYKDIWRKKTKDHHNGNLLKESSVLIMNENILAECQKEFLFNSKYEIGHLNDDEKLLYLSCDKTNKGVGAYIGGIAVDEYIDIAKDIFNLVLSCCKNCECRM